MPLDMKTPAYWRSPRVALFWAGVALALAVVAFLAPRPGGAAKAGGAEQSAVIQPRPFAATISVVGAVTPGDVVGVSAPFDGVVRSLGFTYGDPVGQGQVLAVLDTAEIDHRLSEAQAEFLKASQAASDMAGWASGPEVSQARRAEAQAAADLKDTERKTAQTKGLLDRGLVARDEYEGILQQGRSQHMGLAAARQDLAAALKRGEGSNRRVTALELGNARARLAEVEAQRAGAIVRAPATGVMVHPPSDKGDAPGPGPHAGGPVTKGQLIGAVARPGGLAVTFQLSEADANRVRPGQRVHVTGAGFEGLDVQGVVASVAREASPSSASAAAGASFAAVARLDDLTAAQAAVIRIGMTANVVIDLYRNASALVAPAAAIQGSAPAAFVKVKDPRSGRSRRVAVAIGRVAPDGVEVLSGLKAGDVVVWSAQAPAGKDDDE